MSDGIEISAVNVRICRSHLGVVAAAEDDGDHVVVEDLEELLGDVVVAKRVFEAQVEFVLRLQHLHARVLVGFGALKQRELE